MKSEGFDTIVIPESLSQRVRKGIRQGEKIYMRNKRRKTILRLATAAAALLVCMGVFASQPAIAAKVPVIRSIFKLLQKDYSYQGDLDSVAQKFEETEGADGIKGAETDHTGSGEGSGQGGSPSGQKNNAKVKGGSAVDSAYTKTVDGVTVSISEAYCSVEAIYLSLMITSEEPFADTMMNMDEQPIIYLKGRAGYSFISEERGEAQGYANGGTGSVEGKFLDEHTYAGIYRIDALDIFGNDTELKETYRVLDAFDMDYTIDQIIGDRAEPEPLDRNQFPNQYENWWFDGPFSFQLHIKMDNDNAQVVTVDEMNDTGAGLYQVVKTKFEITVEEKCSEERTASGVFLVVLDAGGKLLPRGGSSFEDTYAINGRDVSRVYVYVCDFAEYMDDIKGHRDDAGFKEILEERALYRKEIVF